MRKRMDRGQCVRVCVCVCVFVYECVLDGFIVGEAEQMGPPYQRVQQNSIQPTVI